MKEIVSTPNTLDGEAQFIRIAWTLLCSCFTNEFSDLGQNLFVPRRVLQKDGVTLHVQIIEWATWLLHSTITSYKTTSKTTGAKHFELSSRWNNAAVDCACFMNFPL